MSEKKLNLKNATVGELKAFLNEIPDDIELEIWDSGEAMVGEVEITYNHYDVCSDDCSIDIEAKNTVL